MISPRAHVDPDVTVGDGTKVWQFASLIRGATLGDNCNIASCAIIDGARLGSGCKVGHGASVHPGAWVGDDVFIGPTAVLCNDVWPQVGGVGFNIQKLLDGMVSILIEDKASIGAHAVVLPGVVVGQGAFVAAGAVVSSNVPAKALWTRDGTIIPYAACKARVRMREAVA